jgi:hypothetical protein
LPEDIYGTIAVPDAVWDEVVEAGRLRPGSEEVAHADWITRRPASDRQQVARLRNDLDPGESEAIALALEWVRAVSLILDERRARRIARTLGLQVVGSAGLLLTAKDLGLISAVEPLLIRLRASGLRLSEQLFDQILEAANEK